MENSSVPTNRSQVSLLKASGAGNVRFFMVLAVALVSSICLCTILLILSTVFLRPHLRENARYILFAHMLINDMVNIIMTVLLYLFSLHRLRVPRLACHFLVVISAFTFLNSINNLAAMSLERYVAICFPLRHMEICRVERCWVAFSIIWALGLLPFLTDLIFLGSKEQLVAPSSSLVCSREALYVNPAQSTIRSVFHVLTFVSVASIIVYTYTMIMLEARKVRADKASTSKASKTVVLHIFQLLLCLTSFISPVTEVYFREQVAYLPFINFFLFILFPRFLSPFIYGLRDDAIRNYMKLFVICRSFGTCLVPPRV
ncbi:odorant receptor 131-2-like [Rhinatrema bivittatum]|uniref:odorant receptor 131-2-like n=1 Tax=Rhinatrema bivittatum TaxID=194408 RepID=UPI001126F15A|nr:odorant receptor 131-2-like [Rhinatrema bivittatum]